MTRTLRHTALGVAIIAMALTGAVSAQTPGSQQPPPGQSVNTAKGQRPPGRTGGRGALPELSANMTPQQLQAYIDAFLVVEAQRQLQLTDEQYGAFVPKLMRLQAVRRQHVMQRRRLLDDLNGLMNAEGTKDEALAEKVRALDDLPARANGELRKAYEEIDALLTPVQRAKLRMFEERLERRKIEMLGKLTPAGAGRGTPAPAAAPKRGGGE
jgi:hypothetical protein